LTSYVKTSIDTTLLSFSSLPYPSNIGGAFFFEKLAVLSTVISKDSTYENCYTASSGAVFYLPPNTKFTEENSKF
jgi:hypothetical protein